MTREEAIKVIKENESEYSPRIKEAIEVLTPELGESREERIKISLIDFLDDIWHLGRDAHFDRYTTADCADWINWVKKQGKNDMGISEATKQKLEDNLNNSLEKETSETWNGFLEEQDEQEKETEQKDAIDMPLIEMSFGAKDSELVGATYYIPEGFHAEIEGNKVIFKQGEQQPAWSRDDEQNLNVCLGYIDDEYLRRWLKDIIHVKYDKLAWGDGDAIADEYIDLGLPSGTLWKLVNEKGYYTFDETIVKFGGGNIPNKEQWEELKEKCKWVWKEIGYEVTGPNGNTIYLPANGYRYGNGTGLLNVGTYGYYWSSTHHDEAGAYYMGFSDPVSCMNNGPRFCGLSVRLVK